MTRHAFKSNASSQTLDGFDSWWLTMPPAQQQRAQARIQQLRTTQPTRSHDAIDRAVFKEWCQGAAWVHPTQAEE